MLKDFKSRHLIANRSTKHSKKNSKHKELNLHHPVSKSPTRVTAFYADSDDYVAQTHALQKEMATLQNALFAEKRQALLIIFQGMDTAGKDSTVKHVMSGLNTSGVSVTAFSRPTSQELEHDFLWRTHARVPARGKIGIFNRSYYEEVTTVRVHPEYIDGEKLARSVKVNDHFWQKRLDDIIHHESYLHRQGIKIVKFLLNISKEEQRKRLLSRINDPDKNWKFDVGDIAERKLWKQYQKTFDQAVAATSTEDCPWYVIPADDKKNARLMISQIVIEELRALKAEYPKVTTEQKTRLKKILVELEQE